VPFSSPHGLDCKPNPDEIEWQDRRHEGDAWFLGGTPNLIPAQNSNAKPPRRDVPTNQGISSSAKLMMVVEI